MFTMQIIRGLVDGETGQAFEYTDDDVSISPASTDITAAKAEAEAYAEWNEHASRFMDAAKQSGTYPKWKKRSINKQEAHDLKFEELPAVEVEDQYVTIRVLVVAEEISDEPEVEETIEEETDSEEAEDTEKTEETV